MSGKRIFLKGATCVGKSTVIYRTVGAALGGGLSGAGGVGGFRTMWSEAGTDGLERLYILPYDLKLGNGRTVDANNIPSGSRPVAEREYESRKVRAHTETFDTEGTTILRSSLSKEPRPKLIVMDELGFLEKNAREFYGAVATCLDSDIDILGVIKSEKSPFFGLINRYLDARIIKVTEGNRDSIPQILQSLIF
jgi:nucleoside-triphosphatase THEP1